MARPRAAAACAALIASLAGCELMRDPTPLGTVTEMVSMHAVLVAGQQTAAVLLTRAEADFAGWPNAEPLPGASVRLIRGAQSIALAAGGDCGGSFDVPGEPEFSAGCYSGVVPGGIVPGARYELEATLPGGGTITGATTVPEPPALLAPAPEAEIEVRPEVEAQPEPFVAAWNADPPGRRMAIGLLSARQDCVAMLRVDRYGSALFLDVSGADSAALRTGLVRCDEDEGTPARLDAHLVLTAYDANYTGYVDVVEYPYAIAGSRASAGVRGAAGVFGSAASASVPVVLVRR